MIRNEGEINGKSAKENSRFSFCCKTINEILFWSHLRRITTCVYMRVQRISKLPAEPSSTTVNNYEALNIQLTYLLVQQMLFYLLHPHLVPCLLQEGDLGR